MPSFFALFTGVFLLVIIRIAFYMLSIKPLLQSKSSLHDRFFQLIALYLYLIYENGRRPQQVGKTAFAYFPFVSCI